MKSCWNASGRLRYVPGKESKKRKNMRENFHASTHLRTFLFFLRLRPSSSEEIADPLVAIKPLLGIRGWGAFFFAVPIFVCLYQSGTKAKHACIRILFYCLLL